MTAALGNGQAAAPRTRRLEQSLCSRTQDGRKDSEVSYPRTAVTSRDSVDADMHAYLGRVAQLERQVRVPVPCALAVGTSRCSQPRLPPHPHTYLPRAACMHYACGSWLTPAPMAIAQQRTSHR